MIAIPSVNPENRDNVSAPYGEKEIAEFVADWLRKTGAAVQTQKVGPRRISVLAVAESFKNKNADTVLLCAHMDTVNVEDMNIEPFVPGIRNGNLYGRGACDDKGPLAAMMVAFRDRLAEGKLPCNVALLATCGEEYDLLGSKYYVQHMRKKPTVIIIGEPTELKIGVAHKGALRLRLETHGKSAHSSTPEAGKNAIYSMGKALNLIEQFSQLLKSKERHEFFGTETIVTTTISGGQNINVIPDKCEAQIDWRILPGHKVRECYEELAQFLKSNFDGSHKLTLLNCFDAIETKNEALAASFFEISQQITHSCEKLHMPYATDASAWAEMNIPTVVVGPGSPAQAHSQKEHICIDELEKGVMVYKLYLQSL